jgi:hypothetical protein
MKTQQRDLMQGRDALIRVSVVYVNIYVGVDFPPKLPSIASGKGDFQHKYCPACLGTDLIHNEH